MKSKALIVLCLLSVLSPILSVIGAESGAPSRDFAVRRLVAGGAEGLPDDSVTAILQTRDGFLWVGTATKLVRFDGVKFTEYPLPLAGSNAPVHVTALCEDAAGKLWVGAQQDGLFRIDETGVASYRKGSGLVDDSVTSLSADAEGRVWIGTRAGLSRWDGKGFTAFTTREGLADMAVTGVHVARSGVVWITTRSGMYQFKDGPPSQDSGAAGRITPFEFETDSQGRRPEYLGAYEDRRGNLWAFGDTYLINLSVTNRYNHFRGVDATRIWSFCEGRDGRLWIGTSGRGLVCFDNNNFQPVTVNELDRPNNVRTICEDREGNLWLGTSAGGLIELMPQPVQVLRAEQGLPPGAATCLATDAGGRIFAAFEAGGLFAGEGERFDRFSGAPSGSLLGMEAQNLIASLRVAADETLWIATLGDGLYGVRGGRKVHLTTLNGLSDNSILALCATPLLPVGQAAGAPSGGAHLAVGHSADEPLFGGAIWAGTRAGALHRVKQSAYSGVAATRPFAEITTFGKEHGLSGAPITALIPARDGGLWLGTEDGQVLRANRTLGDGVSALGSGGATQDPKTRTPDSKTESPQFQTIHQIAAASGQAILALHEDGRGRLWIGTAGAGLGCWTGQRCPIWTTQNGLPDDCVYGVLDDADGDLWLATARGIFRTPRETVKEALVKGEALSGKLMFAAKRMSDPIPTFGWPRVLQANDGRLWFATPEGLVVVDRSGPDLSRSLAPPVYLENVSVNGRRLESRRSKVESHTQPSSSDLRASTVFRLPTMVESAEFEFTAPSFVAPEKLKFRYQLEGQDRDWVDLDAGTERRARYGRLGYGDYRFRVAVSALDGVWNEAAEVFAFTVPTPLWRAPAAVVLYILTAVAAVAGLARVVSTRRLRLHLAQLEQQRVVERERMRIAQDMHDDIGSKLTKISFLSERAKMQSAGNGAVAGQIESIATTSRELLQTLDEIVWAVNPRNDSLEHLAAYLSHYAAEYFQNTEVQCEMRLPREIPHHPLSAELRHNLFLAFEEVLNNALKHSGASRVSIEMIAGRGDFQINVTDNGRGFDVAAAQMERPASAGRRGGNGLVNMRQRLSVVGGECVVRSEPSKGTTVTLRIPLGSAAKIKL